MAKLQGENIVTSPDLSEIKERRKVRKEGRRRKSRRLNVEA